MITITPKKQALFALGVVGIALFGIAVSLLWSVYDSPNYFLWKAAFATLFMAASLIVAGRWAKMNRTIRISKATITVHQRFPRIQLQLPLKEIVSWKLNVVPMKSGDYEELMIVFPNQQLVKISNREHDGFNKARDFVKQSLNKKRAH
jgi:hypothetical protein